MPKTARDSPPEQFVTDAAFDAQINDPAHALESAKNASLTRTWRQFRTPFYCDVSRDKRRLLAIYNTLGITSTTLMAPPPKSPDAARPTLPKSMRALREVDIIGLRQVVENGGPTNVIELNANTLIALVKERNALRGEAKAIKDREQALRLKLTSLGESVRQQAEFVKHLQAQLKALEAVNVKLLENSESPIDERLAPKSHTGNMAQIRAKLPNLETRALQAGLPTLGKKR